MGFKNRFRMMNSYSQFVNYWGDVVNATLNFLFIKLYSQYYIIKVLKLIII